MPQTSPGLGVSTPAKQAHPKKLHSLSRTMNPVAWKLERKQTQEVYVQRSSEKSMCNEFGAFSVQEIITVSPTTASVQYFVTLINKTQE